MTKTIENSKKQSYNRETSTKFSIMLRLRTLGRSVGITTATKLEYTLIHFMKWNFNTSKKHIGFWQAVGNCIIKYLYVTNYHRKEIEFFFELVNNLPFTADIWQTLSVTCKACVIIQACIHLCKTQFIIDTCKCKPQDSAAMDGINFKTDVRFCNPFKIEGSYTSRNV